MGSDDWRRTSAGDNFVMVTVVAPAALLGIFLGVALLIKGLWLLGLASLTFGAVFGALVVRQAQRTGRAKDHTQRDAPAAKRQDGVKSPSARVALIAAALVLALIVLASSAGFLPRSLGVVAALVAVALFLLLAWLGNRKR